MFGIQISEVLAENSACSKDFSCGRKKQKRLQAKKTNKKKTQKALQRSGYGFSQHLTHQTESDRDPQLTTPPPPQTTTTTTTRLLINLHKDVLSLSAHRQPRLHHHDYSLVLVQTSAPAARLNINRMSAIWPRTRSSTHYVTQGTYAHGKLCVGGEVRGGGGAGGESERGRD